MKRKKINHDFFKTIDNEAKAYWLGYFVGDGNVSANNNRITLSSKDHEHLNKFKSHLQSEHKISQNNFAFHSGKIKQDLIALGVEPNKSNKEIITFSLIREDLKRHYLRGLFDADGWVTKSVIGLSSSSSKMLEEIQVYLNKNVKNVSGGLCFKENNWGSVYSLTYGGLYPLSLVTNFLYNDSNVFLDRKKENADLIKSVFLFKIKKRKSKYIGVWKKREKWCAEVSGNKLGTFLTEVEAAKARDKYVIENNLDLVLNF